MFATSYHHPAQVPDWLKLSSSVQIVAGKYALQFEQDWLGACLDGERPIFRQLNFQAVKDLCAFVSISTTSTNEAHRHCS